MLKLRVITAVSRIQVLNCRCSVRSIPPLLQGITAVWCCCCLGLFFCCCCCCWRQDLHCGAASGCSTAWWDGWAEGCDTDRSKVYTRSPELRSSHGRNKGTASNTCFLLRIRCDRLQARPTHTHAHARTATCASQPPSIHLSPPVRSVSQVRRPCNHK